MRIAIILSGFSAASDDWTIPALQTLARGLAEKHDVVVFSMRIPEKGVYRFDNLTHYALGAGERWGLYSPWLWLETVRAVIAQHKRASFDVVHTFWADLGGPAAVLAAALMDRPVIVSLGGWELTRIPEISYGAQQYLSKRWIVHHVLRKATLVTVGSPYQLDLCRQHGVMEDKLALAPLGVEIDRFAPAPLSRPVGDNPILVQAASLVPVKNQALLLKILALVKKKFPCVQLNMVGSGPLKPDLVRTAEAMDLTENIVWSEKRPYPQIPEIYRQSHLYVQTSWHESQGMAVLEAMACGLPVVGTPVGIVKSEASPSPGWSDSELAAQVIDILSDEDKRRLAGQRARQIVEEKYSLAGAVNAFAHGYGVAVRRKRRAK